MRFGSVPVRDAVGDVAAHSLRLPEVTIRKGRPLTRADVEHLAAAGIDEIVTARLDAEDVGEDEAASRLAAAVTGDNLRVEPSFTGRANLFAAAPGLLVVDADAIAGINAVDEAVTLATLAAFQAVVVGEMVATVKIIPYAVPASVLAASLQAASPGPVLRVAPFVRRRVGVVSTLSPGLKASVVAKTVAVLGDRLAPAGAAMEMIDETPHETDALAGVLARQSAAGLDLVVVFGASAIADRRDVIPAAIEAAGGRIEHFGMPVDPGNLLLIGRIGEMPVIGAPGCARSPKENGFDWILGRLLAGMEVTRRDIAGLGVGGLLMEIVSRGQPRAGGGPTNDASGSGDA